MPGIAKLISYQTAAQSIWIINHGLGVMPIVDVLIDSGGTLKPALPVAIVHDSGNTVTTITWSSPRTGQVTLAYPY